MILHEHLQHHHQHHHPSQASQPQTAPTCAGCSQLIHDLYYFNLNVGDAATPSSNNSVSLNWHESCLRCGACQRALDDSSRRCFWLNGRVLCSDHAHELQQQNAATVMTKFWRATPRCQCDTCGLELSGSDYVIRASERLFHVACFVCRACGVQLRPGAPYAAHYRHIYCARHYQQMQQQQQQQDQQQQLTRRDEEATSKRKC